MIDKNIKDMNNKNKNPRIESYLAVTYRPVGVSPIAHPRAYAVDLTSNLGQAIQDALEAHSEIAEDNGYGFNYRIINVTATIDPRVSTQPGLDSMIYIAHIAWWYEFD